jgi:hypothetical protein
MYTNPDAPGYMSNIPPWRIYASYLIDLGLSEVAAFILARLDEVGA